MTSIRRTLRGREQSALRFWLWLLAAYLVLVVLLLILGGQIGAPSASDLGWSD